MRTPTFILALALYVAYAMAEEKSPLQVISGSTDHFATNFFKTVAAEKKNENLISSPLSAHVVLSMAAYGAGGNTAKEMRTALGLPTEDSVGHKGFQNLMDELNNVQNVTLEIANKMYVAKVLTLKPNFVQLTSGSFRSEAAPLDIEHPKVAAENVNGWVKEKTHEKIDKIVEDSDITVDTRMLLLNAVYFKGKWAKSFKKLNTEDRPFYYMQNQEKKEKKVPTMYRNGNYFYGELPDLKAKFVELPYENKDLKMVIIVPDEVDGLQEIEKNLEAFNYSRLAESGSEREIHLYLPRFKIESSIDLQPVLEKLGMGEMFSNGANFSGISDSGLKVDKVLQKAFIEVNEEGSEAAAVTVVQMAVPASATINWNPIPIPTLKADRPFLFEIRDKKNNLTLFSGIIVKP